MKLTGRIVREPLLHFLAAGGLLFAANAWLNTGDATAPAKISITAGEVKWLTETFSKQWGRPPANEELRGLVVSFVRESLLAREAEELGLGKDDIVIRRRLAQKVEFLIQDTARLTPPTGSELQEHYDAHRNDFMVPARVSFTQIYFNSQARENALADAGAALAALSQFPDSVDPASLGDRSLLPAELTDSDAQAVSAQFGEPFSAAVMQLEAGRWRGPIASAFGLHLVRLSAVTPAQQRVFAEAKADVETRWRDAHERALQEAYFGELMKKYDIDLPAALEARIGAVDPAVVPASQ